MPARYQLPGVRCPRCRQVLLLRQRVERPQAAWRQGVARIGRNLIGLVLVQVVEALRWLLGVPFAAVLGIILLTFGAGLLMPLYLVNATAYGRTIGLVVEGLGISRSDALEMNFAAVLNWPTAQHIAGTYGMFGALVRVGAAALRLVGLELPSLDRYEKEQMLVAIIVSEFPLALGLARLHASLGLDHLDGYRLLWWLFVSSPLLGVTAGTTLVADRLLDKLECAVEPEDAAPQSPPIPAAPLSAPGITLVGDLVRVKGSFAKLVPLIALAVGGVCFGATGLLGAPSALASGDPNFAWRAAVALVVAGISAWLLLLVARRGVVRARFIALGDDKVVVRMHVFQPDWEFYWQDVRVLSLYRPPSRESYLPRAMIVLGSDGEIGRIPLTGYVAMGDHVAQLLANAGRRRRVTVDM